MAGGTITTPAVPVEPPGGPRVEPAGRGRPDRRRAREERPARPAPAVAPEDEDDTAPPPTRGRLDVLA
jgi:hypothetical protein